MIVTQELLLAVGGCTTIVQHLIDTGYAGLTRQQFIDKMQVDADADVHPQWWVSWAKTFLKNGTAIVFNGEFSKTNRFRISGLGVNDPTVIYLTIEDARLAVRAARDAQHVLEDWMWHIHAKYKFGADGFTFDAVTDSEETNPGHPVDHYATFNPTTGLYEEFLDFTASKTRMIELMQLRQVAIDAGYYIEEEVQQINDPEENPSGWIIADIGNALA